jgi:putative endonuclease
MRDRIPAVYILASGRNGTLYVGVTSNLLQRHWQHQQDAIGFTARHGVHRLVFYEVHGGMEHAILREKQLKKWSRTWKLRLIERGNPGWRDLWPELVGEDAAVPGALRAPSGPPPARG